MHRNTWHLKDTDQRLIAYVVAPGSAAEAAFRLLDARTTQETAGT
jgi:hypothetical protein